MIMERLEEELGADFVPDAASTRRSTSPPRRASIADLAKGEVALAVAGATWAAADGKKVVTGEEPDLDKLAEGARPAAP